MFLTCERPLIDFCFLDIDSNHRVIGIDKDGQRYTLATLDINASQNDEESKRKLTKEDVFLVTGGARGITPHCLYEICDSIGGGTYICLGRTKMIEEPQWAKDLIGNDLVNAVKSNAQPRTIQNIRSLNRSIVATREIKESMKRITSIGGVIEYYDVDIVIHDPTTCKYNKTTNCFII